MNRIERKVRAARRRVILGRFGRAFCVSMFVGLIVATLAVSLPALRAMNVNFENWIYAWVGGATVAALLASAVFALVTAPSVESVAVEVDKRFGLRERLSSSLTLQEEERDSEFGAALMTDAEKRVDQLAVADRFSLRPSKLGLLPVSIVPILAIVLLLVEPMSESNASSMSQSELQEVKQAKTAATQLKKRIQQYRRKAESEGLKEAKELFEKMEANLDQITKREDLSRKDAMIAMNDLKKQLEERSKELGSSDQLRRALSKMKGLESGPGEKVAKSIEQGKFGEAKEMAKQLANQMRDGKLNEQQKEQLKKQVEQMKDALKKAVEEHEQKKQELKEQIEQARREGRGQDAAEMQQKLNQLEQKDSQMQQMGQMAEAMNQAAKAMEQGDASQAADALQQMADQLGEMQQEMSELEDLESALDQLSQSKSQMRCQKCAGGGCSECQGSGMGQGQGQGQGQGNGQGKGDGLGQGSGFGDRPEQEGDTNSYETQVRGEVRRGRAVIAGFADGPNRKGITREDVKAAIESSLTEETDPSENQVLPRTEREHAQQYFDQLREGE
ncbi:MAG: hypothetical protein P1U77_16930 [Rubripirellula sp.]|nr:hypothetical protein [Rubripirellula sp.]